MALTASEIRYEQAHITDNATTSIIAANVICFVVACFAISLRLVSRRIRRLPLGVDDYLAMLAMIFIAGFLATTFFGRHIILSKNPIAYAKITIAAGVIYAMGVVSIKFSLIFLYRRIFPNRQLHIALWIVGGVVVCMGIAAAFLAVFGCVPVNASWDHRVKRRCIDSNTWTTIYGSQNVVTDFVLLFLPMPLVWRLNMATARKIQVSGILVLGAFASVASIVRITVLKNTSLTDATWADVGCHTWSMVELCMGITSACLPTMGPIFGYIREHPSTTHRVSGRTFAPWRVTPKSGSETMASSKKSRIDFTTKRSKRHSSFTQLEGSQEDVERNWMALAPFDNANCAKNRAVEVNAVRSSAGSHEARSFNGMGITVTTDIQQDALKSSKP